LFLKSRRENFIIGYENGALKLDDGRVLGFAEYGDQNGFPILFFHGTPNSRLSRHPDESILEEQNIRLITIERPGYGESSPLEGKIVLDWAKDVKQFVDYYRIEKFSVMGVSGGVPYALSCAHELETHVEKCGIVSGFAPLDNNNGLMKNMSSTNKLGFWLALKAPSLLKVMLKPMANASVNKPKKQLDKFMKSFSVSDQNVVKNADIQKIFLEDMVEAYKQGETGHYSDLITLVRPWGFSIEDIKTKVHIWHGKDDKNVPIGMARFFEKELPNTAVHIYSDEGHLLYLNHWKDILNQLKP